jgi:hypothetical protein
MTEITTWEEGAEKAYVSVPPTEVNDESGSELAHWVDTHLHTRNWAGVQMEAAQALLNLGHPANRDEIVALLASKQHDYGHDNIDRYGMQGIEVRISDKVCRLKNLLSRGAAAANESLLDTWRDIIGYAVIATMLEQETFSLPLASDLATTERKLSYSYDGEVGWVLPLNDLSPEGPLSFVLDHLDGSASRVVVEYNDGSRGVFEMVEA